VIGVIDRALRALEAAIPPSPAVTEYVAARRPDVVLVTPLVDGADNASQVEYLRAAQALGVHNALPVASWDNLTNKGLVRDAPERVYVWNEDQRREAVELHAIPAERVAVVGAHTYDHWFAWRPTTDRRTFCDLVGLDPSRPFVLYVGSSNFIGSHTRGRLEHDFVRRWIEEIRSAGHPHLRDAGVLMRPHPQAASTWEGDPLAGIDNAVVWPREGADPVTDDAKRVYFDSMFHSAAVVGLNTSALIEAAIVGRRSFTVLTPEYRDQQEGTLHFHLLARGEGGLLTVGRSFAEHAAQLEAELAAPGAGAARISAFLGRFVRPRGMETAAAAVLVDDLEQLAAAPAPAPARPSALQRAKAAVLRRVARRVARPGGRAPVPAQVGDAIAADAR